MGEKNYEAPMNQSFTTEELQEILRWYIELSDDAEADMDVVLHVMKEVDKQEQEHDTELSTETQAALERFRKRREQLRSNNNTLDISPNQPSHRTAPDKPRRSVRRFGRVLTKVAGTAAAMVMLFFSGIGIANAAGYDAWSAVASWTEDIFTFRERGGNLEVNVPTSHEPDGSGSYASLQDALDAYGITSPIAPKWIPKEYAAESVTAITTECGASILALYVSNEKSPDTDQNKAIYVNINFDRSGEGNLHVQKESDDPELYTVNGVEHYIMTNTGDLVATWQREDCDCVIGGNSLSARNLKTIIDSIYWRH